MAAPASTAAVTAPLLAEWRSQNASSSEARAGGAEAALIPAQHNEPQTPRKRQRAHLYISPWITFVASCLLQLTTAGVQYCVALWAGDIKDIFGYSQRQIQGMISPPFFVAVIGWLPGIMYDALARRHNRFGPRLVIAIGLVLHFLGHFGLWLGATGRITLSYWQVVTLAVVGLTGGGWVDTAAIVTSIRNFPRHRGSVVGVPRLTVGFPLSQQVSECDVAPSTAAASPNGWCIVGILKAFVGLSGSVFTTVYVAGFKPRMLNFLLFLAVGPPAVGLALLTVVNHVPLAARPRGQQFVYRTLLGQAAADVRLQAAYLVVLMLAFYQLCISAVATSDDRTVFERRTFLVGTLSLLLPLFFLPLRSGGWLWRKEPGATAQPDQAGYCIGGTSHGSDALVQKLALSPDGRPLLHLHAHASSPGEPLHLTPASGPTANLQAKSAAFTTSASDTLLWAPMASAQQQRQQQGRMAQPQAAQQKGSEATAAQAAQGRAPGATASASQEATHRKQEAAHQITIGAHRPSPPSAPITIGGRRHDWWHVQLRDHRPGVVTPGCPRDGAHVGKEAIGPDNPWGLPTIYSVGTAAGESSLSATPASTSVSASTAATPEAPQPQSFYAEPAILLHPAGSANVNAGKLLLIPSAHSPAAVGDPGESGSMHTASTCHFQLPASTAGTILGGQDGAVHGQGPASFAQHDAELGGCGRGQQDDSAATQDEPSETDMTPAQCLASLDFWLLFLVFGIGAGCGLQLINNLGELVQSLGGEVDGHDVFVSFFSVMNAVGRLSFGFFPERCLHNFGVPRTVWLVVACAVSAGVCTCTALAAVPAGLVTATLGGGAAYGAFWGLMPAIASELFGLTHFGTIYCGLGFATSVSAYLMATQLAGRLYAAAAAAHGGDGNRCFGDDCFGPAFLIAAGLACVATVMAAILAWRTRGKYERHRQAAAGPAATTVVCISPALLAGLQLASSAP